MAESRTGGQLQDYRLKRDFARTPEPAGAPATRGGAAPLRFVVQEHHARSLHWDLRLEWDGVLRSWAVPKGPPTEPGIKRLAMATEDHPMEYIDFEGQIPEGSYGAGTVAIWDRGVYAIAEQTDRKLLLALMGQRLQGAYYLINTKDNQWLMWKLPQQD
jgi:bifunctional non-homologous end joining protein LigD